MITAQPLPATRWQAFRKHFIEPLGRWIYIIPLLIVNMVVIVIPSVSGILYAFTDWNGTTEATFIGLDNFGRLFQDAVFFRAFFNNVTYTGIFLVVPILVGLLGAYLLAGIRHGQVVYRLLYFIPYMFASVINTQIWRYLLHPKHGIGAMLADHGIGILDFAVFASAAQRSMASSSWMAGIPGASWWCSIWLP